MAGSFDQDSSCQGIEWHDEPQPRDSSGRSAMTTAGYSYRLAAMDELLKQMSDSLTNADHIRRIQELARGQDIADGAQEI